MREPDPGTDQHHHDNSDDDIGARLRSKKLAASMLSAGALKSEGGTLAEEREYRHLVQRFLGPNHNDGVNADTVFPHEAPVSRIASK
jgi:hypothetical protein